MFPPLFLETEETNFGPINQEEFHARPTSQNPAGFRLRNHSPNIHVGDNLHKISVIPHMAVKRLFQ